MLFLSGYSGVVGDYLRSFLADYHLLVIICDLPLGTTTCCAVFPCELLLPLPCGLFSASLVLRITVVHYGRKKSSASSCMPPAATAATAAAPSLRRKFATIALVNSLLTTLLYYTMVILICWVWPCEAGYTVNLNFPRFLPAKSGSLGCLLEEGGNIF